MKATFEFAARLPLDTFGFNRLCVYRGTPLWQEYVKRGLVQDATDWYKYFKCSEIDPTCLPGEVINRVRQQGLNASLQFFTIPSRPIASCGGFCVHARQGRPVQSRSLVKRKAPPRRKCCRGRSSTPK